MTNDQNLLAELTGESTRRTILKKSAAATAGLGLGAGAVGSATAQDDGDDDVVDDQEWDKGIMQAAQFRGDARFVITSPVLEWNPDIAEIRDNVWSEYNTRVIRYLNTDEQVLMWQAHDAEVPEFDQEAGYVVDAEGDVGENETPQPEVFRMRTQYSPFGASGFVTVNFTPVGEDEEDDLLDDDDWWYADDDEDAVGIGDDVIDGNVTVGNATNGNATGGD